MQSNQNDLHTVMYQNDMITYAYSRYLNHTPRFLTKDMVEDLARDCRVGTETAFLSLFSAACGLDPDTIPSHRTLEREYLYKGVRPLDPATYADDAYCKAVSFSDQRLGNWEMKTGFYTPYEPFVWNHPVLTPDFREIPQIGYFREEFRFPAILENGVEWMTVTPNEIETMRQPIANAHGNVLTLGLGLGYFAFHAAQKEDVGSVTVIERDASVIELFQTHLLPQFPNRQKIRVECCDAFDFLTPTRVSAYDSVFADLWHDPSDGLPLYLRLRRIQKRLDGKDWDYWIEPSLLSSLRHMVYDRITDPNTPLRLEGVSHRELLSDEFLKRLAPDVKGGD